MHDPPRILIADDNEDTREILAAQLAIHHYELLQAADGEKAIAVARHQLPDLILLDVMMPKIDGMEVCRRLKGDASLPFMPIILVTVRSDTKDVILGLEAGAVEYLTKPIVEYLTKPIDDVAVAARVKSVLQIKELHDKVVAQTAELASWNRTLEQRVASQLLEIERISRLKQFLPPQVAKLIISSGNDHLLESHRKAITVVSCDLRGFTAFAEIAEPEESMLLLREYHTTLGAVINKFEGTVERFAGDGLLVLFNDPLPCPDPSVRAVEMAVQMRDEIVKLEEKWRKHGRNIGFGMGIAHGYATLGCIGFEGRFQYSATGTVANLACRLCDAAQNGQIFIDAKVHAEVEMMTEVEPAGELVLKGFHEPIRAFSVSKVKESRSR